MKKLSNISDYLEFDTALNTGLRLTKEPKTEILGLYIVASIYTGLRTGDMQCLNWDMLCSESFTLKEEKTSKIRTIAVNENLRKLAIKLRKGSGLVFISQKKSVYTTQALNRMLKDAFSKQAKKENISTHSLRKTFGRRVYDMNGQSEHALIKLSELFGHSSVQITRIYLGLKQEELNNIYLNL
jgi:site-specific recombinase XerD